VVQQKVTIQQPQPYDIFEQAVYVGGVVLGFSGVLELTLRDDNGVALDSHTVIPAGSGELSAFQASLVLPAYTAPTPRGVVEAVADGDQSTQVVVPVVFGTSLLQGYFTYTMHVVVQGDTLSGIATQVYGDPGKWSVIHEANIHLVPNPDLIHPGQELRIPRNALAQ